MKKLFSVLMIVIVTVSANAQFNLGGGFGASSKKTIAGELTLGYDFKFAFIKAGYISPLSAKTDNGTWFNVGVGHTFRINDDWSVQPSIGVAYVLKSNDDKSLNGSTMLTNLNVVKDIGYMGQLYVGVNYADKTTVAIIGMRLNLEQ